MFGDVCCVFPGLLPQPKTISQCFQCNYSVYSQAIFLAHLSQYRICCSKQPAGECSSTTFGGGCWKHSRTYGRKSGNAGEVDTAVGMLVHQKSKDCNTSLLRLDFWFSVVQCIGNRADINFPYTTRFGIWSKPWACFSFATPATCIPPYCLAVLVPLP